MKLLVIVATLLWCAVAEGKKNVDVFPDGTPVEDWFKKTSPAELKDMGRQYVLTDYGVSADSTVVQTRQIQTVIDRAASEGGGVIVIPQGTFLSGAIFFRQGTSLYIEEGGKLKGSEDIADFPVLETRIEGETCKYYSALVNADSLDGFKIAGKGEIDGNGLRYWKAFWLRRSWNPQCTNKDEQRPRLVYLSNCTNAEISGVSLVNSPFWTTHIYRCDHVKLLHLRILSPAEPVKAPSTDAIDIDACKNIHVSHCYMAVNDDAIALKGGKGPWADTDPTNGANENIIIEDCEYGFCHGCLTCGSESIHSRNVILRRIKVGKAQRLLWLKMRPDTPQQYEYITVEDITGEVANFIYIRPWTQFFDLKGRTDMPVSFGENITMRNITMDCATFFNVEKSDQYRLSNFVFEHITLKAKNPDCDATQIDNFVMRDVEVTKKGK
ncbi:MAG: glycosyl hydrolase family 28 protein [Bacteroides sp.]|nr:glycosyl hydrolase family 28 protein [Roseburia sp.]MCM1345922.1 glycosyl hydrolase family 28 protein [Bacteroides sp.]MCM1420087.1 glycosyl hydrolase family 28 protein [Bacteroides sp.]